MTQQFIYLNNEDKIKLFKMAQSKQLSVSTYVDIVYSFYNFIKPLNNYHFKGNNRICLKIKNEQNIVINDMHLTNSIYFYLHDASLKKVYPNIKQEHIDNWKRKIQSKLDKTLDYNWNLNQLTRSMYTANKLLKKS